jgi:hypothetical protein
VRGRTARAACYNVIVPDDDATPTPVVVARGEPDPSREPRATPAPRERATTADVLAAIRAIPEQVAAQVKGGASSSGHKGGEIDEVTFVAEPPPAPEDPDDPEETHGPAVEPVVTKDTPRYRFPGARRRRAELIDA